MTWFPMNELCRPLTQAVLTRSFVDHYFDGVDACGLPGGVEGAEKAAADGDGNCRGDPANTEFEVEAEFTADELARWRADTCTPLQGLCRSQLVLFTV